MGMRWQSVRELGRGGCILVYNNQEYPPAQHPLGPNTVMRQECEGSPSSYRDQNRTGGIVKRMLPGSRPSSRRGGGVRIQVGGGRVTAGMVREESRKQVVRRGKRMSGRGAGCGKRMWASWVEKRTHREEECESIDRDYLKGKYLLNARLPSRRSKSDSWQRSLETTAAQIHGRRRATRPAEQGKQRKPTATKRCGRSESERHSEPSDDRETTARL